MYALHGHRNNCDLGSRMFGGVYKVLCGHFYSESSLLKRLWDILFKNVTSIKIDELDVCVGFSIF